MLVLSFLQLFPNWCVDFPHMVYLVPICDVSTLPKTTEMSGKTL